SNEKRDDDDGKLDRARQRDLPRLRADHTDEPRANLIKFTMGIVRQRLSWVVCLWLACQVAGVVAAPLAFCCQSVPMSDDDVCCPGLQPGQMCPMHHKREGDRTCKMRDACGRADAGLVALAGVVGLLPDATAVVSAFAAGGPVHSIVRSAIVRSSRPESPPPRARHLARRAF